MSVEKKAKTSVMESGSHFPLGNWLLLYLSPSQCSPFLLRICVNWQEENSKSIPPTIVTCTDSVSTMA